jgi:hypothetical protein
MNKSLPQGGQQNIISGAVAMVRMLKPTLRTLDTPSARAQEKKADAELLTPEHRARLPSCVVLRKY